MTPIVAMRAVLLSSDASESRLAALSASVACVGKLLGANVGALVGAGLGPELVGETAGTELAGTEVGVNVAPSAVGACDDGTEDGGAVTDGLKV